MAHTLDTVFSEFFLDQIGLKVPSLEKTVLVDCVGLLDEEMETKTVTKSCRGRVKKSRTKGAQGTVTINAHIPYELKLAIYNMQQFATGVYGYGTTSLHQECILTAKVLDEDDNVQYRCYPAAMCNTKVANIDDDADEVAMDELEFTVTADDNEMIVYQALEEDIAEDIANKWMENFSQDLIAPDEAEPTSAVQTTSAKKSSK
ncbi:MAG: hypothetical protein LUD72_12075 [Bacteroidales bacterium]|nr:hypothetical protein [Bacteroidales bacterium]